MKTKGMIFAVLLIFCLGCAAMDGAIKSLHNAPGSYNTQFAAVSYNQNVIGNWAIADMIAEKVDPLTVNTFRALEHEPGSFHIEIAVISGSEFVQHCSKNASEMLTGYDRNLKLVYAGCSNFNSKAIYLVNDIMTEDDFVHEVVHQVVNSFDPILARDERAIREIALKVWR